MVTLTKNGFMVHEWDEEKEDYVDHPLDNLLEYARENVELAEGVTVGDLFEAIDKLHDIFKWILSEYAKCDLDAFIAEYRKEPTEPSNLKFVTFTPIATISEYKDGTNDFSFYVSVGGSGPPDKHAIEQGCKPDEDIGWSISFVGMNNLKNVPLKIEPCVVTREGAKVEPGQPWWQEIAKVHYGVTLMELCREFLWEISFYGGPEKRDETEKGIRQTMKEIEDGTAKLIPMDEVFKKLDEE